MSFLLCPDLLVVSLGIIIMMTILLNGAYSTEGGFVNVTKSIVSGMNEVMPGGNMTFGSS